MNEFWLREVCVKNYRCFGKLGLSLEADTTILCGENGEGKTALLTALAMGIAAFQRGAPRTLKLDAERDPTTRIRDDMQRPEPVGRCKVTWTAKVGSRESVNWSTVANPSSGRTTTQAEPIVEAIERLHVHGDRWPLFVWYGVGRMGRRRGRQRKVIRAGDRREAYASALDPNLDEAPLLQWLQDEMLRDVARRQKSKPERLFHAAVMKVMARATPEIADAWYDRTTREPMVRFENGDVAPWSELANGYRVFMALVADIARRAIILNEIDDVRAPERVGGVALIDKLDLNMHPRWQRMVLPNLRNAFPKLQLVVTTHSPQVLSSAKNRQVRRLINGGIQKYPAFVEGRDTNSILRELMNTDDRDDKGTIDLCRLHDAIDQGNRVLAEQIYKELAGLWGGTDSALIQANWFMEDME